MGFFAAEADADADAGDLSDDSFVADMVDIVVVGMSCKCDKKYQLI